MKDNEKEPFESLNNEQLDELLEMSTQPMSEENAQNIKNKVNQKIKNSKVTPMKKKRKWPYILGVAATLSLMVGFTQRDEIRMAYSKAFGTESEKLLLNADKLDKTAESEGLKLTAKSTFKDGDTTYVMMTLQDLTGDRLSADTRIDSWDMLSGGNTSVIDYDEETKTAVLLTSAISWEDHAEKGFQLKRFKSHEEEFKSVASVDWKNSLQENPKWKKNTANGGGYNREEIARSGVDHETIGLESLEPGVLDNKLGMESDITLENTAFKDDLLHVLVKKPNDLNHGTLSLNLISKSSGKIVENIADFQAEGTTHNNITGRSDYEEFVFDIPYSEIEDYDLKVSEWNSDLVVEGNWAIQLEEPTELEKKKLPDTRLEDGREVSNIELSGLSLSLDLETEPKADAGIELTVILKNGEEKTAVESSSQISEGSDAPENMMVTFGFTPLEDIAQIKINNQLIDVD